MKTRILLAFFLFTIIWAYGQTPYVVMVSFDGFRYDYAERYNLANFKKFINEGASAEALIPSFPSKTFPNHYTLVTGQYPGNHGLVDNEFYDPAQKKLYKTKDRTMVEDPSFYGGIPLWQLAQQHGMKSASFYWVGSEAKVLGVFPDYYRLYDVNVKNEERVDQIINWLKLPEADRPHFISLYFSFVDNEAHTTGPTSAQTRKILHTADSLLGMLTTKVQALKLPVNIIVVSDHGLYEMKRQEKVFRYVDHLINTKDTSVVFANAGSQVHFYTKRVDSLYAILKKEAKGFSVYKQREFPERWHYKNERSGDIMIVADPGTYFLAAPKNLSDWEGKGNFGEHGYDPALTKEMYGIFYAMGPNIKKGVKLKLFENIHVYPFVAKILGLKTPKIDGDEKVLDAAYQETGYRSSEDMITVLRDKWVVDSVEQNTQGFWRIEDKWIDLRKIRDKNSASKTTKGDLYLELVNGKWLIKIVGEFSFYEIVELSQRQLTISCFFQDKYKTGEPVKIATIRLLRD